VIKVLRKYIFLVKILKIICLIKIPVRYIFSYKINKKYIFINKKEIILTSTIRYKKLFS
jgi:hypothetical protein